MKYSIYTDFGGECAYDAETVDDAIAAFAEDYRSYAAPEPSTYWVYVTVCDGDDEDGYPEKVAIHPLVSNLVS